MKTLQFLSLFLLIGLAACTPSSPAIPPTIPASLSTATPLPSPFPTDTPEPTDSQPPPATPTSEPSPTPAVPDISKYTAMPYTLDRFSEGQKAEILGIKAAILAGPSHLSPNAKPVSVGGINSTSRGSTFVIECNQDGDINCVSSAYFQYKDSFNS